MRLALVLALAAPASSLRLAAPARPALRRGAAARLTPPRLAAEPPPPDLGAPAAPAARPPLAVQFDLFKRLAVPYFERAEGAKAQFALMIVLVLCNSGVSVAFSYVSRDFWSTLSAKDVTLFYEVALKFGAALAVATPLTVMYKFQRARLALLWREWMTRELAGQYYSERAYYKIELDRQIDNPDQRIAEDVRAFTRVSLDFFITLMTSVIDLVSFSSILYSIYPDLFYAIFAYAGLGSVATVLLGKALVGQNAEQLVREADLRYSLVRLRENAESIAFYQGEAQEAAEIESRLGGAVENLKRILGTQRNLEFFTVGYRYLIQILPVLVVAPLFFSGQIELGVISQSSGAFNHVLNDLSLIVNEFESLSSFSAGLNRLAAFVERMEALSSDATASSPFNLTRHADGALAGGDYGAPGGLAAYADAPRVSTAVRHGAPPARSAGSPAAEVLAVDELCLMTPDGARELFRNVSVRVAAREHLLIMGNSGAGKSSLLRAIGGLWDRGTGEVRRPAAASVMFLPQRPYCTIGTLRQQLLYPRTSSAASAVGDAELLAALRAVQLGGLVERTAAAAGVAAAGEAAALDVERDWGGMLSLGEQQRLSFARVLVSKPELCVLDEATSALDLNNEAAMYGAIGAVAGLTYVSVGHRPSLLRFHEKRLTLHGAEAAAASGGPSFTLETVDAVVASAEAEVCLAEAEAAALS